MTTSFTVDPKINSITAFLNHVNKAQPGSIKKNDIMMVPVELLEEEDGFNERDYTRAETIEHIDNLAAAYEAGEQLPPLQIKVKNGRCYVRDGHCRRLGVHKAIARGATIERLPCIEFKGDEIEQKWLILKSNQGLQLTALERAALYQKFVNWGIPIKDIAAKANKTDEHIRQQLFLLELPVALKAMINDGIVSASLASKQYKEFGEVAISMIQKTHEVLNVEPVVSSEGKTKKQGSLLDDDANSEGHQPPIADTKNKKKVTEKALGQVSGQAKTKITKKVVTRMQNTLNSVAQRLMTHNIDFNSNAVVNVELNVDEIKEILALKALIDAAKDNDNSGDVAASKLTEEQLSMLGEETIINDGSAELSEPTNSNEEMKQWEDDFNQDSDDLLLSINQQPTQDDPMYG